MSELLRQTDNPGRTPMPRMSLRYRGVMARATLVMPSRGFLGRHRFVAADGELLDVSIGGALLAVSHNVAVQPGIRLHLTLDGEEATVGIRHVEVAGDGRHRCGMAFRTTSPGFEAVVNETIASAITDPKRHQAWRMNG